MPSARAERYLSQLFREEPVALDVVRRRIEQMGYVPFDQWLDFHDRYAGYRENIGSGDVAVWGLTFPHPRTTGGEALDVCVYTYDNQVVWIACADAHPSWDYNLMPDGTFIGPSFPCANFDVKVERSGLMFEFSSAGPTRRLYEYNGAQLRDVRGVLIDELAEHHVPEASDRFANYYASETMVLLESLENDTLKLVVRAD